MASYEKGKRILLMIGPDPSGLGGISRVVKIWQDSGMFDCFKVHYISSVSDHSKSKMMDLCRALMSFVFAARRDVSLVYIHTASFNSFYRKSLFLFLCKILRKRVLLHVHPSYFTTFLSGFKGIKKKIFWNLVCSVDVFVVLTEGIKRDLQALFPEKPIYVLGNPVALKQMENRFGIQRSQNRLLYLGWYNRMKGVYDLADAANLLTEQGCDFELDYYGTKEVDQLRAYIKNKNLEGNVRVNGWADDETKLKALWGAAMLILPSHTEGIPNVILEAMATRTPIISTHVGGLKEILVDGHNALIAEPGNPADLSRKIARMLDDGHLRACLAENAYEETRVQYDVPAIKEKFTAILADIGILRSSAAQQ